VSGIEAEFLLEFGEINFGEIPESNMCISDFEKAFNKYFFVEKTPHVRYKFAELDNSYIEDFEEGFVKYFY